MPHHVPPPPEGDRGWVPEAPFAQNRGSRKIRRPLTHRYRDRPRGMGYSTGQARKSQIPNPKFQTNYKHQIQMTQTRKAQIRKIFRILKSSQKPTEMRHHVPPPAEGDRGWVLDAPLAQKPRLPQNTPPTHPPLPGQAPWNGIFHGAGPEITNPKSQTNSKHQIQMTQTRKAQIRKIFWDFKIFSKPTEMSHHVPPPIFVPNGR